MTASNQTFPERDPAWAGDHSSLGSAHAVQFYENESYLYEVVADFLAKGIEAGEPTVVMATSEHCEGFIVALEKKGSLADACATGQLTFLDARETLSSFMVGSMPDDQLFRASLGSVLNRMAGKIRTAPAVRAYGEMVDLLWRDGNPEAAIRLEQLWNDLATTHSFSLLCAYPMGNFYRESHGRHFEDVCRSHHTVSPAETFARGRDEKAHGLEISRLQQRARALEAEVEHRKELEKSLLEALADRRRAEEEARRNEQLAKEANRIKDEFLATLSHELRTPLTAILGWSRMLSAGTLDEKTARMALETIDRCARAQAALVDDLLDVSRVVAGKLEVKSQLVDLSVIVETAVQTVKLAAEAKSIRLSVAASPGHVLINGDPTRLQQIIWNILANAIKFSDHGGHVAVAIDRTGDRARVIVSDDGLGISEQFLPCVFDPFRQADGATTRVYGGLGLGLAIVKHLTEIHGGTVTATSPGIGLGSTFVVLLPLANRRL